MYNPVRRNRNIGTDKQGHGQDNALTIPQPALCEKTFYERLGNYEKISKTINGHDFLFVVEATRLNSKHACSPEDIAKIIEHIPVADCGDLNLIVLRQPKRKEETLSPVWGRLVYSYTFEGRYAPAVILEAAEFPKTLQWPKKGSLEGRKELERLRADGHELVEGKRHFKAECRLEHVRNTQLYRTLPHEFGHYVHFLEWVERSVQKDEPDDARDKRFDFYFALPSAEKEKYAHQYADRLRKRLIDEKIIPFSKPDDNMP